MFFPPEGASQLLVNLPRFWGRLEWNTEQCVDTHTQMLTLTQVMNHSKNVGGLYCGQSQLRTSVSLASLCHKYLTKTLQ